ncbi:MAG: FMN-dependent NADH-azoreductase [Symplocastrum torsivum CPER-KK1]|jgi:FMN-dependent NADH-azoreductase|uniref:FMN dependent NADH:quinone oxidoreductase n=1 Tax=Symplocastrum torsivum CPER-KK1 TaxID=450513 RepID=A0A951PRI5_9CYAN|nr:FMN-dependent NADH-azoreductase [Symplocastrum torsivum CPER-KK1]
MAHILHLDSSPRGDRSISRTLTKEFITDWKASYPSDIVTYRDLGHYPVPAVDEPWIAASFAPAESRTTELAAVIKTSDELIDEFLAADYYVFGVPMFNFSIPSTLKAYIDQILRVNRTFVINNGGYEGLAKNKKMLIITARGGTYGPGTPSAQYDFQEPYLRTAFGFIGITDITFIHADNLAAGDEVRQQSLTAARAAIEKMVASW